MYMIDTAWFTINGTVLTQCSPQASGCVTIHSGVTRIEERTFKNCTGITALIIPEGVTEIGERCCYHCSSLIAVSIAKTCIPLPFLPI